VPFVLPTREQDRPENPESLFRALRPRDPAVRNLLLRQGDVLRQYAGLPTDEPDVTVELPTGGGKTLVGLLIAEWRRRALGNRVAYLCPTIQLVNQVASKAHDYGLDVVTLVGRQANWDAADFNRFQRGQAVAIAGYYQIFNSNPRLNSAQTLVLDDAHAAEDAVASNWSIHAVRSSLLYRALVAALGEFLPDATRRRLERDDTQRRDRHESRSCRPRPCRPRRRRSRTRSSSTPRSETTPTPIRRR
jgi:RAD3-like DEAD/DEAH box helicase